MGASVSRSAALMRGSSGRVSIAFRSMERFCSIVRVCVEIAGYEPVDVPNLDITQPLWTETDGISLSISKISIHVSIDFQCFGIVTSQPRCTADIAVHYIKAADTGGMTLQQFSNSKI